MQANVVVYIDEVITKLGFYTVNTQMDLLEQMKTYSYAVLFLGLIFSILIILFVAISVLLIYSLLMISVETKTYEHAVMRLVGLSKSNFIFLILLKAIFFVIPSILSAFILIAPGLWLLSNLLGINNAPLHPKFGACMQALLLGIFIPIISALIPI
jgi:ABC-type antimicrobial peptide transport system permease subunit